MSKFLTALMLTLAVLCGYRRLHAGRCLALVGVKNI